MKVVILDARTAEAYAAHSILSKAKDQRSPHENEAHPILPGASLYVGSWGEWCRNEMPIGKA